MKLSWGKAITKGRVKMKNEFYITPEEAANMIKHVRWDTLVQVLRIVEAYQAQPDTKADGLGMLCATLFHAGRVDGIRRERARRRGA